MRTRTLCAVCALAVARIFGTELSPVVAFLIPSGRPSDAECRELVRSVKSGGYDQLCLYPSTGLDWEYLGEDYFRMCESVFAEADRLGMKVWLYDEFNWPSGTARGRVPAENEACLYRELVAAGNATNGYAWTTVVSREKNVDNYCLDTNNLEPASVDRFMELTHRQYEKRFSKHMGTLIRGIFSDEPGHCTGAWRLQMPKDWVLRVPWWSGMEEEYRAATGGRDFRRDAEAALASGQPAGCGVFGVWADLRSRRYRKTYFDPIAAWCRSQGIESTGHLVGEESLDYCTRVNGFPLRTIRGFTKPGIDLIFSNTDRSFDWITLAFGQSAAMANGHPGMAELFGLGPCDLTFTIMRKLYWICALHRIDTFFQATYHQKARRFNVKDSWAMFSSPTQPWYSEMPLLHAAAKEAVRWASKPLRCEIAVVYPQRAAGVAALFPKAGGCPDLRGLCAELTWNQFTYRLVAEDEQTELPVVLDWDGVRLFERRTGTRFSDFAAAVAWLERRFAARPRVKDGEGRTRPGFVTRAYLDGSAVAVDATSGEVIVATDGVLAPQANPKTRRTLTGRAEKIPFSLSGKTRRRVWFGRGKNGANAPAHFRLTAPLEGVVFALRNYPTNEVLGVRLDGIPLEFAKPCRSVAYAYDDLYRETEPLALAAGEHRLELTGGRDGKLFLPALWMVGDFVECERNALSPVPGEMALGSLAENGLGSFAGTVTFRLSAEFAAGERLRIDSGTAVARVRFGGRDLGARGWTPFEWEIPPELVGRRLPLEVDILTSIRPIFGSERDPAARLDHSLWVPPELAIPSPVGLRAVIAVTLPRRCLGGRPCAVAPRRGRSLRPRQKSFGIIDAQTGGERTWQKATTLKTTSRSARTRTRRRSATRTSSSIVRTAARVS